MTVPFCESHFIGSMQELKQTQSAGLFVPVPSLDCEREVNDTEE
jgi:hypothetical protein